MKKYIMNMLLLLSSVSAFTIQSMEQNIAQQKTTDTCPINQGCPIADALLANTMDRQLKEKRYAQKESYFEPEKIATSESSSRGN